MANNSCLKTEVFTKRLPFFMFVLLIFSISCSAQKISNRFSSILQDNGTFYFIYKQGNFQGKQKVSLHFDISYLTSRDSATFNFSYFDKDITSIDSLILISPNKRLAVYAKKLFVEPYGKKWQHRFTTSPVFNDLQGFFVANPNPTMLLHTKNGYKTLHIKRRRWNKISSRTERIITLINYNKTS
jgi:hypothetical protein